jgi:hypothetical protein
VRGESSASNGLFEDFGGSLSRVRSIVSPADALKGVRERDEGPESGFVSPPVPPSPSLTKVSMDFSKLPCTPFRTVIFLFSSLNPISRSFANFMSKSAGPSDPTDAPNTLDSLFFLSGEGDRARCSKSFCAAAACRRDFEDSGNIEEADLKPNLLPVFGGRGGG